MTDFFDSLVAIFVVGALNLFIVGLIRRRMRGEEGQSLARTYIWTLILRSLLAFFLNAAALESSFAAAFWGDSSQYDAGGYMLAAYWRGDLLINPHFDRNVSGWGFFYFVAAIYSFFGRNQLLVQLLNATIGSVTVLVIYAIAKNLFDEVTARWASRFMAFFPQMLFWSGAMYKDPAIMLCIAGAMYSVLQLRTRMTMRHVVLFTLSALVLMTLRFYVFYFVAFATLGTFLLSQRRGILARVLSQAALVAAFVVAFSFAAGQETVELHSQYLTLDRIQVAKNDQASYSSGYGKGVDVSTPGAALSAIPLGLVYLLFAPFPWSISGVRQLLTVPETLVWYALWPSLIRGLLHTSRHKMREALPILAFAASLTCAYAIFQSNVGTAYRQRTQVTMFFFIFMAAGYVENKKKRATSIATQNVVPLYAPR